MTEDIIRPETQSSLRVNVGLLDTLMTLAGELVLSRNQLLQGIGTSNIKATEVSGQRIDLITSELQEAIMQTRMQPIGNVLSKFTRVVRDLSHQLGKSIELVVEGKEVELDKTILEAISQPLTHLVRNAVDHGIELPEKRQAKGKAAQGRIVIKAFHDAGQVNLVISDDGQGMDPDTIVKTALSKNLITEQQLAGMTEKQRIELILMPGFSTAPKTSDVSGKGAGMDVVTANIEGLGGVIDLDTRPGLGTDIQIRLPLTLAIIPSQITTVAEERYAIPQVNLSELLRIPGDEINHRIERVGDAEVVRLRGELLPLLNLAHMLELDKTFIDPETGEKKTDKRINIADRRSNKTDPAGPESDQPLQPRQGKDRRGHNPKAVNIAVVSAGSYKYGLVVDELHDSEEIVVKPVGRHLKACSAYTGATIMGDGKVALILDIANLAQMAGLANMDTGQDPLEDTGQMDTKNETAALLTFRNGPKDYFAVPLSLVERIERIETNVIEQIGNQKVIQYRGGTLPLFELGQIQDFSRPPQSRFQEVIVFKLQGKEAGLMVSPPVDAVDVVLNIDKSTLSQEGISGSVSIGSHTTLLVDISQLINRIDPHWFARN